MMARGRASPFGKESMGESTSNVPDHIRDAVRIVCAAIRRGGASIEIHAVPPGSVEQVFAEGYGDGLGAVGGP